MNWRASTLLAFATLVVGCAPNLSMSFRPNYPPGVDVKVNGLDGPVTADGSSLNVAWRSQGMQSCQLISPIVMQLPRSGRSGPFPTSHPLYPQPGQSVSIIVSCVNGKEKMADSVIVRRP